MEGPPLILRIRRAKGNFRYNLYEAMVKGITISRVPAITIATKRDGKIRTRKIDVWGSRSKTEDGALALKLETRN
jgi:hypothetical protein